jgi:ATP-binding cassette, subfamily C, bacterial
MPVQPPAFIRLLREAPPRDTAVLFALMLASRLTEGVGIVMLVPLLDSLRAGEAPSAVSLWFDRLLAGAGLKGSIGVLLALFVALVAIRSLLVFAQAAWSTRYQNEVIDRLRHRCFGQLLRAEWRWTAQARASDHASLLTAGINRIGIGLGQLLVLAACLASLLAYGAAALLLSWQVTLFAALCGGIAHGLLARHRRSALLLGKDLSEANRGVQAILQEGLAGIRLTKILRNESRQLASYGDVVARLRLQQLGFQNGSNLAQLLVQIGSAILLAVMLYLGIRIWAVPVATLLTIVLIFARLIPMFSTIQQSWHHWLHAVPALDELETVLAASAAAAEPESKAPAEPLPLHEAVTLDNVCITYGGRNRAALDGVSIRLPVRTTTAIIGPSGAGKSSLADVLMALIEPDQGSLTVDGVIVTGSLRHRWRSAVSYVQQDAFLFNDTIRANLLWSHPGVDEAQLQAALSAAAAEFVYALPQGLDTMVGDGGLRLSGGERQRVALARALIGKPALLILDEATSALDPANEALVRGAIARMHGNLTVVIIGHRLADLDQVDQIVRIDQGKARIEARRKAET